MALLYLVILPLIAAGLGPLGGSRELGPALVSQLPRVFLALALVSIIASGLWLLEQHLGPHPMAASTRDFARGMPIVTMMSLQRLPEDSILAWLAYVLGIGAAIALLFSGLRAIAQPARDGSAF